MDSNNKHEVDLEEEASLLSQVASPYLAGDSSAASSVKHKTRWTSKDIVRVLIELIMAITILVLLFLRWPTKDTIKRTPVPSLPRKLYTFHGDPKYVNDRMFFNKSDTIHALHNWIGLSSKSRGFVVVASKDAGKYDLPDPYTVAVDRDNNGPGYMVTVFHQLHCLSYLIEHYQRGYGGANLTDEVAHHSAHCFNYLRQGLMCSADTTLEGETKAGPGEGSEHECTDYDALLGWANANSAWAWRGNVPGETIL